MASFTSRITGSDAQYYRCILDHTSVTATNKPITGSVWATYWELDSTSTSGSWANGVSYYGGFGELNSIDNLTKNDAVRQYGGVSHIVDDLSLVGADKESIFGDLISIGNDTYNDANLVFETSTDNIGNDSIIGFQFYNFANFSLRATLYAGSGGSYYNTGDFVVISRRAITNFAEAPTLEPTDTFTAFALKSILSLSAGGRLGLSANKSDVNFAGSMGAYLNSFDSTARRSNLVISGLTGSLGQLIIDDKRGTISISGFGSSKGTFTVSAKDGNLNILPKFLVFYCSSMCLDNTANSDYTNFKFNSFASTNDYLLGANDNGIYSLTGDDDAGVDIVVLVETHQDDFNIDETKSVTDIYVTYKGGPITVKVVTKDSVWNLQTLELTSSTKTRRVSVGRGIKNINWGVRVENVTGATVDIDKIELRPYKLSGRV